MMMRRRIAVLSVVLSLAGAAAADIPRRDYEIEEVFIEGPLVRPVGPCVQATDPHARSGDLVCYGELYWPPRPPIDWARWLRLMARTVRAPGDAALRTIAIARGWYTN